MTTMYRFGLSPDQLLAGSTRLKAGTATKLCLNALSTLVQARLGKVHGNLMVDVRANSNQKLRARALRLILRLTGLEAGAASHLLDRAQGSVKTAIVVHARGVEKAEAEELLLASSGHLRPLLEAAPQADSSKQQQEP